MRCYGTDGPTDAAGAIVSHDTWTALPNMSAFLANNDSYTALSEVGGLIKTGPTGTNVNDLTVVLIGKPISFE